MAIPEDKLERYDNLIAQFPHIERKGKTVPYTSTNTYMFTFLDKEGTMDLRLGNEDLEDFKETHQSENSVQHGTIMADFVNVPETLFEDWTQLKEYVQMSYDYTNTLKPKKKK